MISAIWVSTVLAGLVGVSMASAAGAPARPWFCGLMGALVAVEVGVARLAHEDDRNVGYLGWRRVELLLAAPAVRFAQFLTGGAGGVETPVPADRETLVGIAAFILVRSAVDATIGDLGAIQRGVARPDGTDPVARIRGRIVGYAVLVTVMAGYAAVGPVGVFDLTRPAVRAMGWQPVLFLAVALPALSGASLRAHEARWRRDGADVDPSTSMSWLRSGRIVSAMAVVTILGVWLGSFGGSSVIAVGITRAGPVGEWISDRFEAIGDQIGGQVERGDPSSVDRSVEVDDAGRSVPPWLGEAMFWAMAVAIIAWAGVKGRHAGTRDRARGRPAGRIGLAGFGRTLREAFVALWRALVGLFRRARVAVSRAPGDRSTGLFDEPSSWVPNDAVRARIAVAYRRIVERISHTVGRRHRSETPGEYAGRSGEVMPKHAADVALVTSAYEEARFSLHLLTGADALAAERAADRVEELDRTDEEDG